MRVYYKCMECNLLYHTKAAGKDCCNAKVVTSVTNIFHPDDLDLVEELADYVDPYTIWFEETH